MDDQLSPDELAYAYFSKPADHSPELTSQLTSELGSEFSLPSVEAHIDITSDDRQFFLIKDIRDAITAADLLLTQISRSLDELEHHNGPLD